MVWCALLCRAVPCRVCHLVLFVRVRVFFSLSRPAARVKLAVVAGRLANVLNSVKASRICLLLVFVFAIYCHYFFGFLFFTSRPRQEAGGSVFPLLPQRFAEGRTRRAADTIANQTTTTKTTNTPPPTGGAVRILFLRRAPPVIAGWSCQMFGDP